MFPSLFIIKNVDIIRWHISCIQGYTSMFNKKIIQEIADTLISRQQTIAVAESVTAGFLQAALASAENASAFFEGGLTAYNINQKYVHLHIDLTHAINCNCVSEQIAFEMAKGVARTFSSNWAIGITGYATPVPGYNMHKLHACYAIVSDQNIISTSSIITDIQEAEEVQLKYVDKVLEALRELVVKELQKEKAG